jgi:DNA-binding Lrp family transcriptional regulator
LDQIDKKIIAQLQINGRATLKEMAKATGYTSMGVKRRIDKLIMQKTLRVSSSINLKKLNLCIALIFLEIKSGEMKRKILEKFRECPRIIHLFTCLAGYNLIALVMAEDQSTLESESLENCSLRNQEGVLRSEFYPINEVEYEPFLTLRQCYAHREKTIAPCGANCKPCKRYRSNKCVGCPATKYYRGPL